jgi:hypothetical protein
VRSGGKVVERQPWGLERLLRIDAAAIEAAVIYDQRLAEAARNSNLVVQAPV